MFWAIIIIAVVVLDQITKYMVMNNIEFGKMIPLIDKFFYLTYHENTGAAWGFMGDVPVARYFFIGLTIIVSIVIARFLYKSENRLLKLSLSFILGGAVGNLIDRILKGSVADFLDFYFGSYHFPTFNAADSFVVVGTFLLAYYLLFIYKEKTA